MSFIPQPCCPDNPPQPSGSCGCSAEAEVSRVGASASAVTVVPANPLRRGTILWNDSTAACYIKFGATAGINDFTWRLATQSGYELPSPVYQGEISAIWEAANGAMQITELI